MKGKIRYIAPDMDVLTIQVEKGYADSEAGGEDEGMSAPTVDGF